MPRAGRRTGYDGTALRAKFRGRLLLRRVLSAIRSPAAADAAVAPVSEPVTPA